LNKKLINCCLILLDICSLNRVIKQGIASPKCKGDSLLRVFADGEFLNKGEREAQSSSELVVFWDNGVLAGAPAGAWRVVWL